MRITQSLFPLFSPTDVEVPYSKGDSIYDIIPQCAYVQGKVYCYKSCLSPYDAIDKVQKYAKLAASARQEHVSMSQVFGIVGDKSGQAQGLLYYWIDIKDSITLTSYINTDTPISLREKWAHQIRQVLPWLHEVGVVWGDVKADIVLIDKG